MHSVLHQTTFSAKGQVRKFLINLCKLFNIESVNCLLRVISEHITVSTERIKLFFSQPHYSYHQPQKCELMQEMLS